MGSQFVFTEDRDLAEVELEEVSNQIETKKLKRERWKNIELGNENKGYETNEEMNNFNSQWSDYESTLESKSCSARQSFEAQTKLWDSFITVSPPEEDETLSSEWMNKFIKCFKLFTYIITFILVLICAVFSKSLVLLMTSMIRVNQNVSLCTEGKEDLARGLSFIAMYTNDDPERIGFIWGLFFVLIAPVIVTFYRSANNCIFKKYENPKLSTFITVFTIETLYTISLVLLIFMVLPSLDSTRGAMLSNSICSIPAILTFISRITNDITGKTRTMTITIDLLSIVIQITSLIVWTFIAYNKHIEHSWVIPIVLFFISLGYWENFMYTKCCENSNQLFKYLFALREDLIKSRYLTYALISIWKIIIIFITMLTYFYIREGKQTSLFSLFEEAFSEHKINILRVSYTQKSYSMTSKPSNLLWIVFLQIIFTFICYKSAKFACKICIQLFSFSFPLTLVGPISIVLVNTLCRLRIRNKCRLTESVQLFEYIFWYSELDSYDQWSTSDCIESLTWVLSLFSQIWITFYIWKPSSERLAKDENIFVNPSYCSVFIDQSLMLNRKFDSERVKSKENSNSEQSSEQIELNDDEIVQIYACATMWHESDDEMVQLLKSVVRMDSDQCARRQARKWFHVDVKHIDYYKFETHIFFDDAFEANSNYKKSGRVVNRFVKQFVSAVDRAAGSVHNCKVHLKCPKIIPTPYGGRLVWTLPGQNKLYVHLKDKNLIRHRKRWSQVMYMYYLLGYRLADIKDCQKRNKTAENTFILALDGDINFRPNAVRLLVDLMKKHKNLGAACGRIHPVGSGPMVWYQMFEYAISHWLQKAAEHVFGCVLCSPGCFSLFRAKALMSDNVMNKYATKPTEAIHYVQYDQGEDRWLCTLLLQQGWSIEYCAASDAYTHCPEDFWEFYIQRRRWGPSTMANIMVLLTDYRHTVQVNENISTLYIIYQSALMIGTILSPGTIFLMVVGAMSTSFKLNSQLCLIYSGAPILLFIIFCFIAKNETQISFSLVLSTVYGLIMLAVLVSTLMEIIQEGLWEPTSLFFVSLCLSFLIAALIHPTEFVCFLPMFLYLLCIPSMYLLLTIYSIINLNVITWGTREVASKLTPEESQSLHKKHKTKNKFLNFLNVIEGKSKSRFMSCICCSNSNPNDDNILLIEIENLKNQTKRILQSLDTIVIDDKVLEPNIKLSVTSSTNSDPLSEENVSQTKAIDDTLETDSIEINESEVKDESNQQLWTSDEDFKHFHIEELDTQEVDFWKEFIHLYLLPLDKDPKHEEKVAIDLKELRNKIAFAFGVMNSLFILLVLLLQMHKQFFNISFEFGKENVTRIYNEELMIYEYISEKSNRVQLDIIGLVLVIFFGFILLIQFIGMVLHRFNTFSHLLAFNELNFCKSTHEITNIQEIINENAVNYAKELQKLNNIEKSYSNRNEPLIDTTESNIRPQFTRLEDAFLKRCSRLGDNCEDEEILPESKLSRDNRIGTISGSDVRKRLYLEVSKETVRRKLRHPLQPLHPL